MIKKILLLLDASSESTNPPTIRSKEADCQSWLMKPIDACHFGGGGGTANAHLACLRGGLVLKLLAAERDVSQQ